MAKVITWTAPYVAPVVTPSLQAGGSLTLGTTYYYRVVAVDHGGIPWYAQITESPASTEVSATPAGANQTIRLTWPQVAGATHYWVHRTTVSGSYLPSKRIAGSPVALEATVADGGAGGTTFDDDGSRSLQATQAIFAAPDAPLGFSTTIGRGSLTITGGTDGDPITFEDIYTAIGDDNFCKYIDDSIFGLLGWWDQTSEATETHFKDTLKTVYLLGGTEWDFDHVDSEFKLGLYDSDKDYSYNGCVVYACGPVRNGLIISGGCAMYQCTFASYFNNLSFQHSYSIYPSEFAFGNFDEIKDCVVQGFAECRLSSGVGTIVNLIVNADYLYATFGNPTDADGVKIKGGSLRLSPINLTHFKGLSTYPSLAYDIWLAGGKYAILINPFFYNRTGNIPVIYWSSVLYTEYVDVFYEFDLTILDKDGDPINGATVTLEDTDGSAVVDTTTDADGVIATQEVKAARYTHKAGSGAGTGAAYTDTDARGPFVLRISQTGYETLYQEFTMTVAIDWTLALRRSAVIGRDGMGSEWR